MPGPWLFDRVADGLCLPGPRHIAKLQRRDVLLDASGAPLLGSSAATATTWRSLHAFSGRCGLRMEGLFMNSPGNEDNVPADTSVSRSAGDYCAWVADFHLRSTCEEPHVLLSVAPHYAPPRGSVETAQIAWDSPTVEDQNTYDKGMLETPLIWEQPMTLSVDCTATGMYMWSEELGLFGNKVADKCFLRRGHARRGDDNQSSGSGGGGNGVNEPYEAFVRLRWRLFSSEEQTPSNDTLPTAEAESASRRGNVAVFLSSGLLAQNKEDDSSGVKGWECMGEFALLRDDVPDEMYFTPYVTLMDAGDEAILL